MVRRLRACVEAWPECIEGDYNPACCRFPKSCSCTIYDMQYVTEADLEPEQEAKLTENGITPLEERMAAAILFMPEIGHLTAGVTKEIISRCARVAVEFGARYDEGVRDS